MRVQHALPQRLRVADGAQNGSERVCLELALGQREADERLDAAGGCYVLRPFAFKPWFDDPRMKGFMDGVSYQNNEWAKQEAVKYDDGSVRVVDPTLTLMCEYILQILLHCGRLRAVVSVRKYLVNAVAELRAREAAEPDE